MTEDGKALELIFVFGLIFLFIVFVGLINFLNYKDHKKTMDRMYPRDIDNG